MATTPTTNLVSYSVEFDAKFKLGLVFRITNTHALEVYSFSRPEGEATLSPAEACGKIKLGDLLVGVNSLAFENYHIEEQLAVVGALQNFDAALPEGRPIILHFLRRLSAENLRLVQARRELELLGPGRRIELTDLARNARRGRWRFRGGGTDRVSAVVRGRGGGPGRRCSGVSSALSSSSTSISGGDASTSTARPPPGIAADNAAGRDSAVDKSRLSPAHEDDVDDSSTSAAVSVSAGRRGGRGMRGRGGGTASAAQGGPGTASKRRHRDATVPPDTKISSVAAIAADASAAGDAEDEGEDELSSGMHDRAGVAQLMHADAGTADIPIISDHSSNGGSVSGNNGSNSGGSSSSSSVAIGGTQRRETSNNSADYSSSMAVERVQPQSLGERQLDVEVSAAEQGEQLQLQHATKMAALQAHLKLQQQKQLQQHTEAAAALVVPASGPSGSSRSEMPQLAPSATLLVCHGDAPVVTHSSSTPVVTLSSSTPVVTLSSSTPVVTLSSSTPVVTLSSSTSSPSAIAVVPPTVAPASYSASYHGTSTSSLSAANDMVVVTDGDRATSPSKRRRDEIDYANVTSDDATTLLLHQYPSKKKLALSAEIVGEAVHGPLPAAAAAAAAIAPTTVEVDRDAASGGGIGYDAGTSSATPLQQQQMLHQASGTYSVVSDSRIGQQPMQPPLPLMLPSATISSTTTSMPTLPFYRNSSTTSVPSLPFMFPFGTAASSTSPFPFARPPSVAAYLAAMQQHAAAAAAKSYTPATAAGAGGMPPRPFHQFPSFPPQSGPNGTLPPVSGSFIYPSTAGAGGAAPAGMFPPPPPPSGFIYPTTAPGGGSNPYYGPAVSVPGWPALYAGGVGRPARPFQLQLPSGGAGGPVWPLQLQVPAPRQPFLPPGQTPSSTSTSAVLARGASINTGAHRGPQVEVGGGTRTPGSSVSSSGIGVGKGRGGSSSGANKAKGGGGGGAAVGRGTSTATASSSLSTAAAAAAAAAALSKSKAAAPTPASTYPPAAMSQYQPLATRSLFRYCPLAVTVAGIPITLSVFSPPIHRPTHMKFEGVFKAPCTPMPQSNSAAVAANAATISMAAAAAAANRRKAEADALSATAAAAAAELLTKYSGSLGLDEVVRALTLADQVEVDHKQLLSTGVSTAAAPNAAASAVVTQFVGAHSTSTSCAEGGSGAASRAAPAGDDKAAPSAAPTAAGPTRATSTGHGSDEASAMQVEVWDRASAVDGGGRAAVVATQQQKVEVEAVRQLAASAHTALTASLLQRPRFRLSYSKRVVEGSSFDPPTRPRWLTGVSSSSAAASAARNAGGGKAASVAARSGVFSAGYRQYAHEDNKRAVLPDYRGPGGPSLLLPLLPTPHSAPSHAASASTAIATALAANSAAAAAASGATFPLSSTATSTSTAGVGGVWSAGITPVSTAVSIDAASASARPLFRAPPPTAARGPIAAPTASGAQSREHHFPTPATAASLIVNAASFPPLLHRGAAAAVYSHQTSTSFTPGQHPSAAHSHTGGATSTLIAAADGRVLRDRCVWSFSAWRAALEQSKERSGRDHVERSTPGDAAAAAAAMAAAACGAPRNNVEVASEGAAAAEDDEGPSTFSTEPSKRGSSGSGSAASSSRPSREIVTGNTGGRRTRCPPPHVSNNYGSSSSSSSSGRGRGASIDISSAEGVPPSSTVTDTATHSSIASTSSIHPAPVDASAAAAAGAASTTFGSGGSSGASASAPTSVTGSVTSIGGAIGSGTGGGNTSGSGGGGGVKYRGGGSSRSAALVLAHRDMAASGLSRAMDLDEMSLTLLHASGYSWEKAVAAAQACKLALAEHREAMAAMFAPATATAAPLAPNHAPVADDAAPASAAAVQQHSLEKTSMTMTTTTGWPVQQPMRSGSIHPFPSPLVSYPPPSVWSSTTGIHVPVPNFNLHSSSSSSIAPSQLARSYFNLQTPSTSLSPVSALLSMLSANCNLSARGASSLPNFNVISGAPHPAPSNFNLHPALRHGHLPSTSTSSGAAASFLESGDDGAAAAAVGAAAASAAESSAVHTASLGFDPFIDIICDRCLQWTPQLSVAFELAVEMHGKHAKFVLGEMGNLLALMQPPQPLPQQQQQQPPRAATAASSLPHSASLSAPQVGARLSNFNVNTGGGAGAPSNFNFNSGSGTGAAAAIAAAAASSSSSVLPTSPKLQLGDAVEVAERVRVALRSALSRPLTVSDAAAHFFRVWKQTPGYESFRSRIAHKGSSVPWRLTRADLRETVKSAGPTVVGEVGALFEETALEKQMAAEDAAAAAVAAAAAEKAKAAAVAAAAAPASPSSPSVTPLLHGDGKAAASGSGGPTSTSALPPEAATATEVQLASRPSITSAGGSGAAGGVVSAAPASTSTMSQGEDEGGASGAGADDGADHHAEPPQGDIAAAGYPQRGQGQQGHAQRASSRAPRKRTGKTEQGGGNASAAASNASRSTTAAADAMTAGDTTSLSSAPASTSTLVDEQQPPPLADDRELSDIEWEFHKNDCPVCDGGGTLLCCSTCDRAYHTACIGHGQYAAAPTREWICPPCDYRYAVAGGATGAAMDAAALAQARRVVNTAEAALRAKKAEMHAARRKARAGAALKALERCERNYAKAGVFAGGATAPAAAGNTHKASIAAHITAWGELQQLASNAPISLSPPYATAAGTLQQGQVPAAAPQLQLGPLSAAATAAAVALREALAAPVRPSASDVAALNAAAEKIGKPLFTARLSAKQRQLAAEAAAAAAASASSKRTTAAAAAAAVASVNELTTADASASSAAEASAEIALQTNMSESAAAAATSRSGIATVWAPGASATSALTPSDEGVTASSATTAPTSITTSSSIPKTASVPVTKTDPLPASTSAAAAVAAPPAVDFDRPPFTVTWPLLDDEEEEEEEAAAAAAAAADDDEDDDGGRDDGEDGGRRRRRVSYALESGSSSPTYVPRRSRGRPRVNASRRGGLFNESAPDTASSSPTAAAAAALADAVEDGGGGDEDDYVPVVPQQRGKGGGRGRGRGGARGAKLATTAFSDTDGDASSSASAAAATLRPRVDTTGTGAAAAAAEDTEEGSRSTTSTSVVSPAAAGRGGGRGRWPRGRGGRARASAALAAVAGGSSAAFEAAPAAARAGVDNDDGEVATSSASGGVADDDMLLDSTAATATVAENAVDSDVII